MEASIFTVHIPNTGRDHSGHTYRNMKLQAAMIVGGNA